jgi:NADH-quinone oxidoreductase subunit E
MALAFSSAALAEKDRILAKYPMKSAACLPLLHLAQQEFGHVSLEAMEYVAGFCELTPARVYGVATFYTMYNKAPVGKHLVQVCMNICCAIRGAEEVFDYISSKLGITAGQTSKDGKYTLMKVECLGACGNAPMMQIDDDYHEDLTRAKVDEIFAKLK